MDDRHAVRQPPKIGGVKSPPLDHADYAFGAPEGEWTGRLDYLRWGRKSNLICYFTDVDTGGKYFLSGFQREGYGPRDMSISFRYERIGALYRLTTGQTPQGKPAWYSAKRTETSGGA